MALHFGIEGRIAPDTHPLTDNAVFVTGTMLTREERTE